MLTRRPLNKPSRALVATGSLLECRFFRAGRFQHSSTNNLLRYSLPCCTRWTEDDMAARRDRA